MLFCSHLDREGLFEFFLVVFMVPRGCCVALPLCALGLSAVCDCGNS